MTCWWFPAQTSCVIAAVGFQKYLGTSLPVMKRHERGDGKASGSHALTPQLLLLLTSRDASGPDFNLPQDDWNYSKPKAKHTLFPSLYYLRTYFTSILIFTLCVMFYFIPMLLEAVHTSSLFRPKWTHYSYLSLYWCFFFSSFLFLLGLFQRMEIHVASLTTEPVSGICTRTWMSFLFFQFLFFLPTF